MRVGLPSSRRAPDHRRLHPPAPIAATLPAPAYRLPGRRTTEERTGRPGFARKGAAWRGAAPGAMLGDQSNGGLG